ncbi:MAG TPA: hypothetical protein VMF13_10670 [Luteitalea sp.]|nr:hypothetical protein [Luteitalea sp.]
MRHLTSLGFGALVVAMVAAVTPSVVAQRGGWLLVVNKGDRALGIIDPTTGAQVAAVPLNGVTGHEVAASPDGKRAFVPIYGDSGVGRPGTDGRTMAVVDLTTRTLARTVDFGAALRPHHPVVSAARGKLFVTTELANTITELDLATMKVTGTTTTARPEAHMLAITRDGRRGYTANVASGTVSVLDLEKHALVKVLPLAATVQRISLSVDDAWAFTSDQSTPTLLAINTKTHVVERKVTLPSTGYGTASTPDGKFLVVALSKANKVAIVNLGSFTVERVIDVPAAPQFVLMRPDGGVAYVSCDVSGQVVAIRTKDWTVEKVIAAGKQADGLAWAPAS